ncbi:MAG: hypothetical protein QG625_1069 [Cyanobacteriota bacterium erpe_2018_sw_39hr_WHONDRS-SW48-000098_B_bin.30]|jgi:hypothetical protein|nr:hypothetical protein [Candidatus Obscuribacter sp.]MDQ5964914.1 hypothetical protein [Cyanobacteriota bacterium erpe_2018_sw_39hr_WHONDRS-SW48-000098_B_bin.30]
MTDPKDKGDASSEQSGGESHSADKSAADKSAADKSAADKSAANKPSADNPSADKPVDDWMEFARKEGFDFVPEKKREEGPKLVYRREVLLAQFWSRALLGVILFIAFIAGAWVAGTALHDPDTCWLLALGRDIYNHGAIPRTDPFSYTFAGEEALGKKFVLYQWLSELVFYLATLPGGLVTLLMLAGVCIVTAFLSLPLSVAVRRESPFMPAFAAVLLGMLSASFHTLVRPEIFSFVFLSVYLQVIHHVRACFVSGDKTLFPVVLVLAPVMVLWANMHTGFITGASVLLACLLGSVIALAFLKRLALPLVTSLGVAFFGIAVASLINPYGIGLWQYIPSLFFCKTNKIIVELAPLDPTKVVYAPFLLLIAFWLLTYIKAFIYMGKVKSGAEPVRSAIASSDLGYKLIMAELVMSALVGSIGIYNAFRASRLISFIALMLVAEISALLGLKRLVSGSLDAEFAEVVEHAKGLPVVDSDRVTSVSKRGFWWHFDHHILDLWKTGGAGELAIVCSCAIAGVALISNRVTKPELPTSSVAFTVPNAALDYIASSGKELGGRMFNDPQYGDVMIWRKPGEPKVFIDTRFDMYGDRLVFDYLAINEAHPDYAEQLDKYKIDWVFVRANAPIALKLKQSSQWQKLLEEQEAVIFKRTTALPGSNQ